MVTTNRSDSKVFGPKFVRIILIFFSLVWWLTTTPAPYSWSEPSAWSSDRLYNWGDNQGDSNLLSDETDWVDKYYRCQSIRLNGKAGAQFYNARYYTVYVSKWVLFCYNMEESLGQDDNKVLK